MTYWERYMEWTNALPWWVIISIYLLMFCWMIAWLIWKIFFERHRWIEIADIGGWVYYQHKKNPKRRLAEPSSHRSRPNAAWLRGETDDPASKPDTSNVVVFPPK